eukprot:SAG31_NODE_30916_length_374_cov_1.312727_1_plen_34_part_01
MTLAKAGPCVLAMLQQHFHFRYFRPLLPRPFLGP